jgi:hypothetical protein
MIPVTQFILGNSDPLLYPSEKMTNSIDEQIAFLQSQKQAINEAYRRNAIPNANNGTTQNQQVPTQGIWDAIDAEIAPLTQEQQNMLLKMYHVKDNKKYIGEKYDMNKAHEICERYKEVLPNDVEPCDIYVAINAQYHDYAKLFEEWFGGNIDNKVFESAITFWFKDVDFDGDKVWEYFHMNN